MLHCILILVTYKCMHRFIHLLIHMILQIRREQRAIDSKYKAILIFVSLDTCYTKALNMQRTINKLINLNRKKIRGIYRHRDIIKDCSILNLIDFRRNIPLTNGLIHSCMKGSLWNSNLMVFGVWGCRKYHLYGWLLNRFIVPFYSDSKSQRYVRIIVCAIVLQPRPKIYD